MEKNTDAQPRLKSLHPKNRNESVRQSFSPLGRFTSQLILLDRPRTLAEMSGLTRYGLDRFDKIYNHRQRLCLSTLVITDKPITRGPWDVYPVEWVDAICGEVCSGN